MDDYINSQPRMKMTDSTACSNWDAGTRVTTRGYCEVSDQTHNISMKYSQSVSQSKMNHFKSVIFYFIFFKCTLKFNSKFVYKLSI